MTFDTMELPHNADHVWLCYYVDNLKVQVAPCQPAVARTTSDKLHIAVVRMPGSYRKMR